MKSKLLFLIIIILINTINIKSQNVPYVTKNNSGTTISVRASTPCTSSTAITSIPNGSKVVGSAITTASCSYDWFKIDIPLTSVPTINYYAAKGTGLLECDATTPYVEVYNTGSSGLFVRTSAGSGNVTISGSNAKIWDSQRFATTGNTASYGGYTWYQIYLANNCSQTTGWVSSQYLTYHNGQSCVTCITPSSPTNVSAIVTGQTSANFSWGVGSPSGTSPITYYWVVGTSPSVTYGNGIDQGITTNTSVSTNALLCNTIYYFRVYAVTGCDGTYSAYSTSSSFTTQACSCITPGTPLNVSGIATSQTSANLSWASGNPVGSPTITYYWVVGTSPTVTYQNGVAQGGTNNTSISVSNLSCNTTYYLRVFASTSCNSTQSAYGTSSSFTTSNCQGSAGLYGVDISALNGQNGNVNWSTVYQAGKTFAYVKATKGDGVNNGNCYIDSKFNINMTSSNPNNVVLGAYHFALPEDNPGLNGAIAEANYFYNASHLYLGNGYLPPALDLETPSGTCAIKQVDITSYYNGNYVTLAQWVQNWCNRIHILSGRWPILYTTKCIASALYPYYQNGTINNNIKLWIATNNILTDPPGQPNTNESCGGSTSWSGWPWVFHQFYFPTSGASNNPITYADPGMDQDYFAGTLQDLINLTNLNVIDIEKPKDIMIYPNPFKDFITIKSKNSKIFKIKIFDINGKIINYNKNINENEFSINLNFLINGIYIINITTDNGIKSFKIIKN